MAKAELEACDNAARIFLGMNPNYTAIPAWNKPGMIDCQIAKQMNMTETDPVARMTRFFVSYVNELWNVVTKIESNGIDSAQFQEVGAKPIVQKYYLMLIGYVAPTPDQQVAAAAVSPESRAKDDDEPPEVDPDPDTLHI
jgi:hypothetical protein